VQPVGPTGVSGGGNAQEYYDAGLEKMADGAYGTARRAFEQLLREFRTSELAPAAQYQIGEAYAAEGEHEKAVAELEKVAAEWPAVKEAPQALYRAGVIAADDLKRTSRARELLNRVVNGYGQSPEAALARTKLRSLPR
jgi:tol-pal system protein YbgF